TTKFDYDGQRLTHSQIRLRIGKSIRCRRLGFYYKEAIVAWKSKQVKLFFSRQGKNGKWKVLMTTNTNLSFIQMIKIYQIRWTIEVFFKEAKQLLGLGRCQSNDFDAQIADMTTTMIQHQILTLRFRFEHYESKGELFSQAKEEIIQLRLNERLWGLFLELVKIIETIFDGVDSDDIIFKLLNDEKVAEYFSKIFGDVDIGKAAA
ncbi:MAG: transposase, partial [Cyclobacteriaceae bacterium]|nr:transposase [Cyclobacteriaceae bacterium]